MTSCHHIKPDGDRCRSTPIRGEQWCYMHHPDTAEKRRAQSRKGGKLGGRKRPRVELSNIRAQLQGLVDSVGDGSRERADAAVMGQLLNFMTRCMQIELQAREQEELVERLVKLEAALKEQRKMSGRGVV